MDWTIAQLDALRAVIDNGSFEAGADALRVTPSAVSQRIRALESQVGRVLVRRSRPVRPTESGTAVLRLARQVGLLVDEATAELRGDAAARTTIAVVVNADSLSTWVLPAVVRAAQRAGVQLELLREDQAHSLDLLRDGTAMAVITSDPTPVQGCVVEQLGPLRYWPMAAPAVARRYFADGVTAAGLAAAPVVIFDRKDDLQDAYLRDHGVDPALPMRHWVPSTADFTEAIRLGLGWGMVLLDHAVDLETDGDLVRLDAPTVVEVPLYWQQWRIDGGGLEVLASSR